MNPFPTHPSYTFNMKHCCFHWIWQATLSSVIQLARPTTCLVLLTAAHDQVHYGCREEHQAHERPITEEEPVRKPYLLHHERLAQADSHHCKQHQTPLASNTHTHTHTHTHQLMPHWYSVVVPPRAKPQRRICEWCIVVIFPAGLCFSW